jgi:hypothetical protein
MTGYQNNRPERCGRMIATLRSIEIGAMASLDHYGDNATLLRCALAELAEQASNAVTADEAAQAADAAEFEKHMAEREQAHECGTPPAGALDTSDYPARMFVFQRDPADSESWMFRCSEGHALTDLARAGGWQSPDYATEGDALIAAGDHARAMHDMGLPAELAERVAAAERAWPPSAAQITAAVRARESAQ